MERRFPGAGEGVDGELVFKGDRVSLEEDEKRHLEMVVMAAQPYEYA